MPRASRSQVGRERRRDSRRNLCASFWYPWSARPWQARALAFTRMGPRQFEYGTMMSSLLSRVVELVDRNPALESIVCAERALRDLALVDQPGPQGYAITYVWKDVSSGAHIVRDVVPRSGATGALSVSRNESAIARCRWATARCSLARMASSTLRQLPRLTEGICDVLTMEQRDRIRRCKCERLALLSTSIDDLGTAIARLSARSPSDGAKS